MDNTVGLLSETGRKKWIEQMLKGRKKKRNQQS